MDIFHNYKYNSDYLDEFFKTSDNYEAVFLKSTNLYDLLIDRNKPNIVMDSLMYDYRDLHETIKPSVHYSRISTNPISEIINQKNLINAGNLRFIALDFDQSLTIIFYETVRQADKIFTPYNINENLYYLQDDHINIPKKIIRKNDNNSFSILEEEYIKKYILSMPGITEKINIIDYGSAILGLEKREYDLNF